MPYIWFKRNGRKATIHWGVMLPRIPGSEFGQAVVLTGCIVVAEAAWRMFA